MTDFTWMDGLYTALMIVVGYFLKSGIEWAKSKLSSMNVPPEK